MPFVHIELIKGRSPEQLENLMKDVTRSWKNPGPFLCTPLSTLTISMWT